MAWCSKVPFGAGLQQSLLSKYISSTLTQFTELSKKFPTEADDWCLSKISKFPISVIMLITLLWL